MYLVLVLDDLQGMCNKDLVEHWATSWRARYYIHGQMHISCPLSIASGASGFSTIPSTNDLVESFFARVRAFVYLCLKKYTQLGGESGYLARLSSFLNVFTDVSSNGRIDGLSLFKNHYRN
ncbi:hypothetical protein FOZ63_011638, partial [Perkinsus olseni]